MALLVVQQGLAPGGSGFARQLAEIVPANGQAPLQLSKLDFEEGRSPEAMPRLREIQARRRVGGHGSS